MKFDLHDLKPQTATLKLGERSFTLRPFTLAGQIWAQNRFGKDNIQGIFENQKLGDISEIAHYLLKGETLSLNDFQECVVTQQDRINLITALLETVGLSQPVIEKLVESTAQGNEQSLSQLTGAPVST